jgi:predicted ABC-class ATPase
MTHFRKTEFDRKDLHDLKEILGRYLEMVQRFAAREYQKFGPRALALVSESSRSAGFIVGSAENLVHLYHEQSGQNSEGK